jgi:outer membrane protein assembly factor BamB
MHSQKASSLLAISLFTVAAALPLRAAHWPQWRGPNFNGSSPETGLPATFSKTEGVAWVAPLPGVSGATPVIWGDHVFVSSPDPQKNLLLLCLNRRDGSVRWQKTVTVGDRSKGNNNMASPSPVTDGQSVFVLYGTSDLAAYDFHGAELWRRNLGKDYGRFSIMWIYGSSPLLHQGRLYVLVLQRDPPPPDYPTVDDNPKRDSYLLCLDPKTGKDLWRHIRPTDAVKESMEAYTTPIPYSGRNGPEILVVGGDYATGHDPSTGAELWRCGGLNPRQTDMQVNWFRIVPSPVAYAGFIYACGPKGEPVIAVKDGGQGNVTDTHIAWRFKESPTDWSTPLVYRDRLYVLNGGRKTLSCLNAKTGEKIWSGSLGVADTIWSSPTGADGKIYCLSEKGTVIVCDAGEAFKILASVPLDEGPSRSSIAVASGQLFIRTAKNLYCVGKK